MVAQDARNGGVPPVRLEAVTEKLPADFETMQAEARAEGHEFFGSVAKISRATAHRKPSKRIRMTERPNLTSQPNFTAP